MRKASFKVTNSNSNSSKHNDRTNAPRYLVPKREDNYYERIYSDEAFLIVAESDYNKTHKRKMQQKQKDALIKETVLNLETHHKIADVKNIFKNLNKKYGGHYPIEFAIHNDEGHFEKDGIPYYPTKHILQKDDGWYIVPLEKFLDDDFTPNKNDFSEKVNINEFQIIYNKHCHVKFSMYDMKNHTTGRMTKGEVSQRLKFVAENLNLKYEPETKRNSGKAVKEIKREHDLKRRGMIKTLFKTQEIKKEQAENENLKIENENLKYNFREMQKKITSLENLDNSQKRELHKLNSQVKNGRANFENLLEKFEELQAENKHLKVELSQKPKEVEKIVEKKFIKTVEVENPINRELQAKYEALFKKLKEKDNFIYNFEINYGKEMEEERAKNRELQAKMQELKDQLLKKPKQVEVEKEVIKEVEKIVENPINRELQEKVEDLKEQLLKKPKQVEVEKEVIKTVEVEKIVEKEVIKEVEVEIENPINKELQEEVEDLKEQLQEKNANELYLKEELEFDKRTPQSSLFGKIIFKMKEYKSKINKLLEEIKSKDTLINTLKSKINSLESKISTLANEPIDFEEKTDFTPSKSYLDELDEDTLSETRDNLFAEPDEKSTETFNRSRKSKRDDYS